MKSCLLLWGGSPTPTFSKPQDLACQWLPPRPHGTALGRAGRVHPKAQSRKTSMGCECREAQLLCCFF